MLERRWRRRSMVLAAVMAIGVVGCGGQSEVNSGDYTIFVHGGSLLPRGGEDALIEGVLTIRSGCVLLQMVGFDHAYPVIWPSGTSIAGDDPLTLRLPSGDDLVLGQAVSGGGGYHQATSDRVDVGIPAQCLDESGQVAIFNPDARLTIVGP